MAIGLKGRVDMEHRKVQVLLPIIVVLVVLLSGGCQRETTGITTPDIVTGITPGIITDKTTVSVTPTNTGEIPIVLITDPLRGKRDVRSHDKVSILFSKPMDIDATEKALTIKSNNDPNFRFNVSWEEDGRLMLIVPVPTWRPQAVYTVTIRSQAKSVEGIPLGEDYSFYFQIDIC